MASNLMMWEAIRLEKNWDFQNLIVGALGPNADRMTHGTGFIVSKRDTALN